jgi:hypothetical protein
MAEGIVLTARELVVLGLVVVFVAWIAREVTKHR